VIIAMTASASIPKLDAVRRTSEAALASLPLDTLSRLGVHLPIERYYLVGTYPPLKAMQPISAAAALRGLSPSCNVYLHIPFCEQRCTFCHFAKEILPPEQRVARYVDALRSELGAVQEAVGRRVVADTVYFGGGTPSYLNAAQIAALFASLRQHVELPAGSEVTFELHPSIIDAPDYADRLQALMDAGVNRWVFGAQSLNDRVLKKLNRGHDRSAVYRLLGLLGERGLDNYSVDLMFGLPYQTLEDWYETLHRLLSAGVQKFNIFPLMFKQADPISAHYRSHPELFPDLRQRLLMHFMAEAMLFPLGYRRGPLFYYARSATHSRQQENKYDSIEDINLLPFGVSSFGYVGHTQYYNDPDVSGYLRAVESGRLPVWRGIHLDTAERMRRTIMFTLRSGGVDRADYRRRYGVDAVDQFAPELGPLREHGLLEVDEQAIRLTDRGAPFADGIALRFVSEQVVRRVRDTNAHIRDLKRDPVDRYDFSPIERVPVGAAVATHPRQRSATYLRSRGRR
jgi:oxygen-independent coproporphyrinogen-3 oxidase